MIKEANLTYKIFRFPQFFRPRGKPKKQVVLFYIPGDYGIPSDSTLMTYAA